MLEKRSKKNSLWPVLKIEKNFGQAEGEEKFHVVEVPIEAIYANPEQPRKIFKPEELEELSDSIREYGVLQPIILKAVDEGKYILIAGERRYRAACLAGLTKMPAIIKNLEEEEAALIALVENVQRENLNYIEEARAYKRLMDDFNLTQGEIAKRVGKQQSTISNKIRILSLPPEIQEVLTENRLTERHARALLKLDDEEERKKVIERVIKHNLNVKQTEKLIEDLLANQEEQRRKRNKINYISYKIYVNTIRKAFSQIKEMEENAKFSQEDKGEFLELKITIPKNDRCFT